MDLVKNELLKLIGPTRAEEACISYNLHQDNKNENLFLFHEGWTNRDLWKKHMQNAHLLEYVKATEGAAKEFILNEMTHMA